MAGISTVIGLATALIACALKLDTLSGLCCILLGVGIAVWGASMRALLRVAAGSLVALFGLGVQVWLATQQDNVLRWVSLSAVGILLIFGSAYVERNRSRLARFLQHSLQQVSRRRVEEQESL